MTTTHETRTRRLAAHHGMRLHKLHHDAGYWLIDNTTNALILGEQISHGVHIGYDLDTIERYLSD